MQLNNLLNVQLSQLGHGHPQVHRQEMSTLSQSVYYNPNHIMALEGSWQMGHKVHGYAIPFPHYISKGCRIPLGLWCSTFAF